MIKTSIQHILKKPSQNIIQRLSATPIHAIQSQKNRSLRFLALRPLTAYSSSHTMQWNYLGTPADELRLEFTLPTGQSFRWKEIAPDQYLGVIGHRAVLLKQLDHDVAWAVLSRDSNVDASLPSLEEDREAIAEYFNLSVSLSSLAQQWKDADEYFAKLSKLVCGARMLRQDPLECLFSFICSQNNHISRIHGMVNKLCQLYGTELPIPSDAYARIMPCRNEPGETAPAPLPLYSFPTLTQLQKATEDELRAAGFGYRAKFIVNATQQLTEKPEGGTAWLMSLRNLAFDEACEALCTLSGVGPKVAACAALFSLDKHSSIPVDTHVWQIAVRKYTPHLRGKSLTPKLHGEVQSAFINRFGPYAGWAHNTLFIFELKSVQDRLLARSSSLPVSNVSPGGTWGKVVPDDATLLEDLLKESFSSSPSGGQSSSSEKEKESLQPWMMMSDSDDSHAAHVDDDSDDEYVLPSSKKERIIKNSMEIGLVTPLLAGNKEKRTRKKRRVVAPKKE